MMGLAISSTYSGGEIMSIVTLGIDLAKNVFAIHGVNAAGQADLKRPAVRRDKLEEFVAELPPCLIPQGDLLRGRPPRGLAARASAGKPAPAPTNGRGALPVTGTPSSSLRRSLSLPIDCPANAARTMRRMRSPSAKRYPARSCAASPSRASHSKAN